MKTLVKIFIDHEHLGRVMNILTELGITGFYLYEYNGMAPNAWRDFQLREEPEMTVEAIRHHAELGVLVNTVVNNGDCERITKKLEQSLKGIKYTVMGHKVSIMKVSGD
ncbi:MAG: MJ1244 family protein [Methanotrichaceae archaeon]